MLRCMRTTLTIDPDVAAALERERDRTGASLKQTINDLLRAGLDRERSAKPRGPEPPTVPFTAGEVLIGSLDSVADVLAWVEGDDYK